MVRTIACFVFYSMIVSCLQFPTFTHFFECYETIYLFYPLFLSLSFSLFLSLSLSIHHLLLICCLSDSFQSYYTIFNIYICLFSISIFALSSPISFPFTPTWAGTHNVTLNHIIWILYNIYKTSVKMPALLLLCSHIQKYPGFTGMIPSWRSTDSTWLIRLDT